MTDAAEMMGGALAEAVRAAVAAERTRREAAEASATRSADAAVDAVRELGHIAAAAVTRADAAEAECARLRECLQRANATIEETERARFAAEDERDAVLELVAPDAMEAARLRDDRDAARLAALVVARVALADAELILEERERQLTAALTAVAEERARCAAVCRAVAALPFIGDVFEHNARVHGVNACIVGIESGMHLMIERGEVGR